MGKRRTPPTPPTFPPLSPVQEQAIELMLAGQTVREIATALQLAPDEVQRWRHEHPVVVARLNQAKRRRWDEAQDRLRALVPQAIATLEKAMQHGSVRAAVELLKVVQLYGGVGQPSGAEDPQGVVWQQAKAWAVGEVQRDGPDDDEKLWDDRVHQRLTLTQQKAGELLAQWTTNGDEENPMRSD